MKTKRLFMFFAVAAMIAGCNNVNQTMEIESDVVELTINEFKERAEEFAGDTVLVKGLVNHACRHSGKRMFIVDQETSEGLRVDAGKIVAGFDNSLEGSMVLVTGVVMERRIDEAYLNEWESEVQEECAAEQAYAEGEMADAEAEAEADEETEEEDPAEDLDRIAKLRQQVLESEKGYISFFHLECISYDVIEENAMEEEETIKETETE
jgi:outer membrane murein-binding lipoprotein Lpp